MPGWASAIRVPRADAADELMHTAQCVEIMRPLLPLLVATTLIYTGYIAFAGWPVTGAPATGWVGLGLAAGAAILLGLGLFARRLAANPLLCARAMDGKELLDVVKHDEGLKAIPVVILTSSQAPAEILECYRRHANGYVLKPWGMEEFIEMLRELDRYWNGLVVRPAAA